MTGTARPHRRQPHRSHRAAAGRGPTASGRAGHVPPARASYAARTASCRRPRGRRPAGGCGAARAALEHLREAAGADVTGHVGDADPMAAISDTLHEREIDEIIISTLPRRLSRWVHLDLPSKVRGMGMPVTHVEGDRVPTRTEPVLISGRAALGRPARGAPGPPGAHRLRGGVVGARGLGQRLARGRRRGERHEALDGRPARADGRAHRIPAARRRDDGEPAARPAARCSSSSATAAREMNAMPRPARVACLIAPLEPSVSVCGSRPAAARNSSLTIRVPEPGSRISQMRCSSSAPSIVAAAGVRIVGRGDQHEVVGQDRDRLDARVARRAPADRDVGAVVEDEVEHLLAVADGERQADRCRWSGRRRA